jgi:uncharacterized membrane protein YdcZ (DUF606 family)
MSHDPDELKELRERVRWLVAGTLVAGIMLDRVGPAVLGERYTSLSDWALALVLAAVLVLLGIESVAWLLKR